MEIYEFFSRKLEQLDPDFEKLSELHPEFSHQLTQEAAVAFGPKATYIFCVLNSVIIRPADFESLQARSGEESKNGLMKAKGGAEEIERLEQRYQRKLEGLERRHQSEIKALKSQIAHLSRRLTEQAHGPAR